MAVTSAGRLARFVLRATLAGCLGAVAFLALVRRDHKVELVDQMKFTVRLTGTADMIRALKERPELISVYARLDKNYWKEGIHQIPVRCDLPEEFRKEVTVQLAPGEPILASVRVIRS